MKTPKEWFEEELSGEPLTQESVIEVLEMVQKDAWNAAIDKAADNVELKRNNYFDLSHEEKLICSEVWEDNGSFCPSEGIVVNKDSILKLKI